MQLKNKHIALKIDQTSKNNIFKFNWDVELKFIIIYE
jgi:hypothetical protein